MHIIIATRVDPPLPLPRFRGRGMMLEMDEDDLRFTKDEAAELFEAILNTELSAENIDALNTRAEGWAVGLKMAALSMRGQRNIEEFLASFTGSQRYIMDYLVEEVLKRQPAELHEFLLTTSVLDRLSASLCDHVTGGNQSRHILSKLEKENLFLIPLDESRQWYRYHHLFGELLRHQFEEGSGTDDLCSVHRRASQWYEDKGFMDDAVQHGLAARDWDTALRLMYKESQSKINKGELRTVHSWCQALPQEVLRSHTGLYVQYARTVVYMGELEQASAVVSQLEQESKNDQALQGEVASLQASLAARRGDTPRLVEEARKALRLLPAESYDARGRTATELAFVPYYDGHLDEAVELFVEGYENAKYAGDYWIAANALGWAGRAYWMKGNLRLSAQLSTQAVELAGQSPAAASPL